MLAQAGTSAEDGRDEPLTFYFACGVVCFADGSLAASDHFPFAVCP